MTDLKKAALTTSVLVTVYNRAKYLNACLDSILSSTSIDFEIVIVDDCSTDGSIEIAQDYASRDKRIVLHQNKKNLGDYPNRIRAATIASGKYIKFVDSDDLIYPHSLAIMVQAMDLHPTAALGVSQSLPEAEQPYPWELTSLAAWRIQFLGSGCLNSGPTGAIIRRDAFIEVGGFRDWGVLSDADLWYRMAARWPVLLLPPGLVWWRRHDDQEFSRNNAEMVYLEQGFLLTMQALSSGECPLSGVERRAARRRARQHHARRLIALGTRRRHPLIALGLFRSSGLTAADMLRGLRGYS